MAVSDAGSGWTSTRAAAVLSGLTVLGLIVALVLLWVRVERLESRVGTEHQRAVQADALAATARKRLASLARSSAQSLENSSLMRHDLDEVTESLTKLDDDFAEAEAQRFVAGAVKEKALPATVVIECLTEYGGGQGSGFAVDVVVDDVGATPVLTNAHVVEGCEPDSTGELTVRQRSTDFAAEVVRVDTEHDLALLSVQGALPRLEVADAPADGDEVLALGAPFGIEGTGTTGTISNIDEQYFQIDAPINHGNSGGPLLDRHGEVLGVNAAKLEGDGAEGIAWAIRMKVACATLVTC